MRGSSCLTMIPFLSKKGAKIFYYDPTGEKKEFAMLKNVRFFNNIYQACHDADLIIIHTDWDEFKSIDFKKIIKRKNTKVYDLRNLYSSEKMNKKGISYYSIGR